MYIPIVGFNKNYITNKMLKKFNNFHKEKKIVKENDFFGKYFELLFFGK
jgi:hypothetical protein